MAKQEKNPRRVWNLVLAVHLSIYLMICLIALYFLSILPTVSFIVDYTQFIAAVLLWLPVLGLHIIAHVASDRQTDADIRERALGIPRRFQ